MHGFKTGSNYYPHDPLGGTSAVIKNFPAIRIGDSPSKITALNAKTESKTLEQSKPSLAKRAPMLPELRGERLKYNLDQIVGNSERDSDGSVSVFTKTHKASDPGFVIPTATP